MEGTLALQGSAQLLLGGGASAVERLAVMVGPMGRRSWPDAVKARIVLESFKPETRVVDVVRRHGIAPQQLTAWRRLARQGKRALPVDEGAAPVEIEMDGLIVRLAGDPPAARLATISASSAPLAAMEYRRRIESGGRSP